MTCFNMRFAMEWISKSTRFVVAVLIVPSCIITSLTYSEKVPLHILGLYPMSGAWPGGYALREASQFAVDHVNANDSILPDYRIIIDAADSACSGGRAVDSMYRELYNTNTTKLMVLGGGCSLGTLPTAESSHLWNLVQITYGALTPKLSNRQLYPLFFRIIPPESSLNILKIAVVKHFGWDKIATINPPGDTFDSGTTDFRERADQNGINVAVSEIFTIDPRLHVTNLKKLGLRIIIGNFYEEQARRVFCQAYKEGMYGGRYVWFTPGWYSPLWWRKQLPEENIDCTLDEMDAAVNGYFGVSYVSFPKDADPKRRVSKMTGEDYIKHFDEYLGGNKTHVTGFWDSPFGYDGVWAIALALDKAEKHLQNRDPPQSLEQFHYGNQDMANLFFSILNETSFEGVTGAVRFTATGDREGPMKLEQNQNGTMKIVGLYDPSASDPETRFMVTNSPPVYWQAGSPPVDEFIEVDNYMEISRLLFIALTVLSSIGIVLTIIFLAFNLIYRNHKMIKMSSPRLNNVILAGGFLAYVSIILSGFDSGLLSHEYLGYVCKAYVWSLAMAFALSFGAMFSKTWRVYRIFTNMSVVPTRIRDPQLFAFVGILAVLNIAVLILWELLDPLYVVTNRGLSKSSDENEDIIITPVLVKCVSNWQLYWKCVFFAMYGVLFIFGAFLAWETRNVKIPALNDSKLIGMSIYTVMTMCFTGVPVSFLVQEPNSNFALIAFFTLFSTTLTMCLIFLPKVKSRNDEMRGMVMKTSSENGGIPSASKPSTQTAKDACDKTNASVIENTNAI